MADPLAPVANICSTAGVEDRAWEVDFYVVDHVNDRWATVGGWYGPWAPGDDAAEALRGYLETSRLPDGRYRVSVSSAPANAGAEIDFKRMTPLAPVRQLRQRWNADYTT